MHVSCADHSLNLVVSAAELCLNAMRLSSTRWSAQAIYLFKYSKYGTDQYTISTIIKKKHTNAFSTTQVYTIKHLSAGKFTTIYGERNFNKPKLFTNAKVTFPTILEMHCSRCNKTSLFAPPRKCGE